MSSNETDSDPAIRADCEERETFPIYVLSFVYSFLAALIVAHLLFRWHWRRRKLSRFRSSQPGDKSFKSKTMRDILKRDFSFIQALRCDPRLIHRDFSPRIFGQCSDGEDVPDHWYKMAAFDAAADFVSAHAPKGSTALPLEGHAPRPHPHQATPLSDYLNTLNLSSSSTSSPSLVNSLTELYKLARYKDGEFGKDKLQLFQEQLQELTEILEGNVSTAASARPPPVSEASLSSPVKMYRQSTTTFSSQDPLLRMSSTEVMTPDEPPSTKELVQVAHPHSTSQVVSTMTVAMEAETSSPRQPGPKQTQRSSRQHSRAKKPGVAGASESELSPLVTMQMSPGSPPISTLLENVFEDSARFTVGAGGSELRSSPQLWQKLDDSAASVETQV